jgi:hypothetical protein
MVMSGTDKEETRLRMEKQLGRLVFLAYLSLKTLVNFGRLCSTVLGEHSFDK